MNYQFHQQKIKKSSVNKTPLLIKVTGVYLMMMVYRGALFVNLGQCDLNRVLGPCITSLKQVFLEGNRLTGIGKVCGQRFSCFSTALQQQMTNVCGSAVIQIPILRLILAMTRVEGQNGQLN